MDEAERCHEIAYIAFGRVLARGTVSEVIANSHLTTFTVEAANGENLAPLARELATRAGVDTVAPFGRVSMFPAATARRSKRRLHPIKRGQDSIGSAPAPRSRMCSSP